MLRATVSTGGQKEVFLRLGDSGQLARVTFRVGTVRNPTLSLGKLLREGFTFHMDGDGHHMEKGGVRVRLEMHRNSLWVKGHAFGDLGSARWGSDTVAAMQGEAGQEQSPASASASASAASPPMPDLEVTVLGPGGSGLVAQAVVAR